jgi:hypothetical protein
VVAAGWGNPVWGTGNRSTALVAQKPIRTPLAVTLEEQDNWNEHATLFRRKVS